MLLHSPVCAHRLGCEDAEDGDASVWHVQGDHDVSAVCGGGSVNGCDGFMQERVCVGCMCSREMALSDALTLSFHNYITQLITPCSCPAPCPSGTWLLRS